MSPQMAAWKALIGRALLAAIFIIMGAMKIPGFAGMVAWTASFNVPMPEVAVALAILIELGGGLMILAGWHTRLAAKALVLFLVVVTAIFHSNIADQMQLTMALKNLSILGGVLILIAHGPGAYSFDAKKGPGMA